jgi:hypothetical protein
MTEAADYFSEAYERLLEATVYISNDHLPPKFILGAAMPTPLYWTPLHDFALLRQFVKIGYNCQHNFYLKPPKIFSKLPPAVRQSPSWLFERMQHLLNELYVLIPSGYVSADDEVICYNKDFQTVQPTLFSQQMITRCEQRHIVRFLIDFGIPDLMDKWNFLRDKCEMRYIEIDVFRKYIEDVVNNVSEFANGSTTSWNVGFFIPHEFRIGFHRMIEFFETIRSLIIESDLTGFNETELPPRPEFWTRESDIALVRTVAKYGFRSNARLVLAVLSFVEKNHQRLLFERIGDLKSQIEIEELTGNVINFADMPMISNHEMIAARVSQILESCPKCDPISLDDFFASPDFFMTEVSVDKSVLPESTLTPEVVNRKSLSFEFLLELKLSISPSMFRSTSEITAGVSAERNIEGPSGDQRSDGLSDQRSVVPPERTLPEAGPKRNASPTVESLTELVSQFIPQRSRQPPLPMNGPPIPQTRRQPPLQMSGLPIPQMMRHPISQMTTQQLLQIIGPPIPRMSGQALTQMNPHPLLQIIGPPIPRMRGQALTQMNPHPLLQITGPPIPRMSGQSLSQIAGQAPSPMNAQRIPQMSGQRIPQTSGQSFSEISQQPIRRTTGQSFSQMIPQPLSQMRAQILSQMNGPQTPQMAGQPITKMNGRPPSSMNG